MLAECGTHAQRRIFQNKTRCAELGHDCKWMSLPPSHLVVEESRHDGTYGWEYQHSWRAPPRTQAVYHTSTWTAISFNHFNPQTIMTCHDCTVKPAARRSQAAFPFQACLYSHPGQVRGQPPPGGTIEEAELQDRARDDFAEH